MSDVSVCDVKQTNRKYLTEENKVNLVQLCLNNYRDFKKNNDANFPVEPLIKPFKENYLTECSYVRISDLQIYKTAQRGSMRNDGYNDKIIKGIINNPSTFNYNSFEPLAVSVYENEQIVTDGFGRIHMLLALGCIDMLIPAIRTYRNNEIDVLDDYDKHHDIKCRKPTTVTDIFLTLAQREHPIVKDMSKHAVELGYSEINTDRLRGMDKKDCKGEITPKEFNKILFQNHTKNHLNSILHMHTYNHNPIKRKEEEEKTMKTWNQNFKETIFCSWDNGTYIKKTLFDDVFLEDDLYTLTTCIVTTYNKLQTEHYVFNSECTIDKLFDYGIPKKKGKEDFVIETSLGKKFFQTHIETNSKTYMKIKNKYKNYPMPSGKSEKKAFMILCCLNDVMDYSNNVWGKLYKENEKTTNLEKLIYCFLFN